MLPLLWQTIEVEDGRVGYAWVAIHARKTPPPKRTPRFLPAFLSVEIPGAEVDRATLVAINGTVLEFSDVSAAGAIRSRTIRFYRAGARLADLRFDAIGLLTAANPMQIEASSRVSYTPQGLPRWVMNGDLDGDLAAIGVTGELTQPFRATLSEGVLKALGGWGFTGKAHVFDLDLRAFGAGPLLGKISGDLELGLDRQGYRASGTLDSSGLRAGAFNVGFDGSYARRVLTARRIVLVHRGSGARVEAAGDIGIVPNGPRLGLAGRWQDFRWPLSGAEPVVRSAEGSFRLGDVWPYALQLEGPVEPVPLGIAPLPLKMSGRLAKNRVIVESAELQVFDGVARGGGEAAWSPVERWGFGGGVTALNPVHLRPDLPGKLDFRFAARGEGYGGGTLDVDIRELRGVVRGTAARGSGSVGLRGDTWSFAKVDVVAGGVRANLDGTLSPAARDLTFRLDASDLSVLAPQSRGTLRARGTLRRHPRGAGAGARCARQRHRAPGHRDRPRRGRRRLRPARRPQVDGARQRQRAEGARPRDRARRADARRPVGEARAGGRGPLRRASCSTRAPTAASPTAPGAAAGSELDLQVGEQVELALDGNLEMTVSTTSGSIPGFCLRDRRKADSEARLCAGGDWDPRDWQGQLDATALPLATLTAGLSPQVRYEGTVDVTARGSASGGAPPVGTLRADLTGAQLRHRRNNGKEDLIKLGSGLVTATATRRRDRGEAEARRRRDRPHRGQRGRAARRGARSPTCRCAPTCAPPPTRSAC